MQDLRWFRHYSFINNIVLFYTGIICDVTTLGRGRVQSDFDVFSSGYLYCIVCLARVLQTTGQYINSFLRKQERPSVPMGLRKRCDVTYKSRTICGRRKGLRANATFAPLPTRGVKLTINPR